MLQYRSRDSRPQNGGAGHVKQSESPRFGAVIDRFRSQPVRLGIPACSHCITTHACMLSPGPAAGGLPSSPPLLHDEKLNSNHLQSAEQQAQKACGPPPRRISCENNTMKDRVCKTSRCAGVSCVVRMKGTPGKDNA